MNQDEVEEVLANVFDIESKAAKNSDKSKLLVSDSRPRWSEGERSNENNEAMQKVRNELDKWHGPELNWSSREGQSKRDDLVRSLQRAIEVRPFRPTHSSFFFFLSLSCSFDPQP